MTQADCKRLVTHHPAPDVTYRSGIDLVGREVVPAELEDSAARDFSEDVLIPIEFEFLGRLGSGRGRPAVEASVLVGTIELRDGRAYFNGRPLDGPTESELTAKCQKGLTEGG